MKTQGFMYRPDPEETGGNYTPGEDNTTTVAEEQSGTPVEEGSGSNAETYSAPSEDNAGTYETPGEPADNGSSTAETSGQPAGENTGGGYSAPSDDSSQSGSGTTSEESSAGGSESEGTGQEKNDASAPDEEYIGKVLKGSVIISKGAEVTAILGSAEFALEYIEPIGGVLEVAEMIHSVWEALELPDRTCGYQGLVYGLMYHTLGMGDPQPNPAWPDLDKAPAHDEKFFEGVELAKKRLQEGEEGVRRRNLLLLDIGKRGEKTVINSLWQSAISKEDHLLKSFTVEWPRVGPNG